MRIFALCLLAACVASQRADTYETYSVSVKANQDPKVLLTIPEMDIEAETKAADEEQALTKVFIFGKINNVSKDFFSFAHRQKQENGVLYTAAFRNENALSLAIHFDQFDIPYGGAVWVVGDNQILGPWTHKTRWTEGNLMTQHVQGNQVTIVYFENGNAKRAPLLHVDVVTGAFRNSDTFNAGLCNIQAICVDAETCSGCSPTDRSCSIQCTRSGGSNTGHRWADSEWGEEQQMATVAMATSAGSRFCSGSFINNRNGDPLVLTAAHCGVSSTALVHIFWRNPECVSTSNTAGDFEARGDITVLTTRGASDMALLRVGQTLPDGVYLSGWEAGDRSTPATNVIGLHHPRASNMKISHGGEVRPTRWSGSGDPTHWRIDFWSEATTEPGSSGSPMYNRDTKRIIGQLHGGSAACPANNGWDAYGAIWSSYENDATFRNALTGGSDITHMDGAFY